jgi:hypothetical protein
MFQGHPVCLDENVFFKKALKKKRKYFFRENEAEKKLHASVRKGENEAFKNIGDSGSMTQTGRRMHWLLVILSVFFVWNMKKKFLLEVCS